MFTKLQKVGSRLFKKYTIDAYGVKTISKSKYIFTNRIKNIRSYIIVEDFNFDYKKNSEMRVFRRIIPFFLQLQLDHLQIDLGIKNK